MQWSRDRFSRSISLADQISCRSYCSFWFLVYFRTIGIFRSDTLRFLKHGTGHAVECSNSLAQPHLFFAFETPIGHFGLLALRSTWCGNAFLGAQVSSKCGTWYSAFCNLSTLLWLALHIFATTVLTTPKKGETAVFCCDPRYIGSCHVGVSKRFFT